MLLILWLDCGIIIYVNLVLNTDRNGGSKMEVARRRELRTMLMEHRREVAGEIKERMRDNRDENDQRRGDKVRDFAEDSEVSAREDVELALIQMKSETLTRIDQALGRLDQGTYGNCLECGEEIAEKRLRALPFAFRCKDCQEAQEAAEQRERRRQGAFGLLDQGPRFDSQ